MKRTQKSAVPLLLSLLLLLGFAESCNQSSVSPDVLETVAAGAAVGQSGALTTGTSSSLRQGKGPLARPVVYVRSQGLFYDSIVTADPLPMRGPFQKLEMGPNGLETDFGPGDPGYLGGRWWEDLNGNGEMDEADHFFICPLMGPGRESP